MESNFFTLHNVQADAQGNYRCVVNSSHGSATSNVATLSITAPPVFSTHPSDTTTAPGANITLNASAIGTGVAYQWQKDNVNIGGATGLSYVIANIQGTDSGVYQCVASNVHGTVKSNPATVTVMVPPSITVHPADMNATIGNNILLTTTASGPGALTYQWQKDGTNLTNAFTLEKMMPKFDRPNRKWGKDNHGNWCYITAQGAFYRKGILTKNLGVEYWSDTTKLIGPSFLQLINVQSANSGTHRCIVTNSGGSITSNGAVLSVQ